MRFEAGDEASRPDATETLVARQRVMLQAVGIWSVVAVVFLVDVEVAHTQRAKREEVASESEDLESMLGV